MEVQLQNILYQQHKLTPKNQSYTFKEQKNQ